MRNEKRGSGSVLFRVPFSVFRLPERTRFGSLNRHLLDILCASPPHSIRSPPRKYKFPVHYAQKEHKSTLNPWAPSSPPPLLPLTDAYLPPSAVLSHQDPAVLTYLHDDDTDRKNSPNRPSTIPIFFLVSCLCFLLLFFFFRIVYSILSSSSSSSPHP